MPSSECTCPSALNAACLAGNALVMLPCEAEPRTRDCDSPTNDSCRRLTCEFLNRHGSGQRRCCWAAWTTRRCRSPEGHLNCHTSAHLTGSKNCKLAAAPVKAKYPVVGCTAMQAETDAALHTPRILDRTPMAAKSTCSRPWPLQLAQQVALTAGRGTSLPCGLRCLSSTRPCTRDPQSMEKCGAGSCLQASP